MLLLIDLILLVALQLISSMFKVIAYFIIANSITDKININNNSSNLIIKLTKYIPNKLSYIINFNP